ncbi:MAG: NADH:flavin oxidoreductase [Negativicutes bacterium]|nr:NADH:flavin oxidoreductase [Negativicutes bacterium]
MSVLNQPITLGKLKVKNRFVRSATQDFYGEPDGRISDKELALYQSLAENNLGLIITAHSYVQHPLGKASINQNAIYDDKFIPGYHRLTDIVHAAGAALVVQISHAGRQVTPDFSFVPIAPSAVEDTSIKVVPREMTEDEIWQMIDAFAAAMGRVKAAGCDGIQLHIAHGYGLAQFISPHTNRRSDIWGGSIENRTRILREIITRGRSLVGDDYPVLAKLNSTDGPTSTGYLSLDDVVHTAKSLEKWGVAAIEVSGGIRENRGVMSRPAVLHPEQEAYFSEAAKTIKAATNIPIILVGGLRSLAVMEDVVSSGVADMVSLSRPLVKEPDLVTRLLSGQAKATCVSCNACFNPAGLQCWLPKKE